MKRILLAITALVFAGAAHANPTFEGEDHAYASLLLGSSAIDVKVAAKALALRSTSNAAVYDLAADLLWRSCRDQRAIDADAQAWVAIALGKSGEGRYRDVLSACAGSDAPAKVRSAAKDALGGLPGEKTGEFAGGSLQLDEIAAQLAAAAVRDRASRAAKKFNDIWSGQSIAQVYAIMGLPEAIQGASIRPARLATLGGSAPIYGSSIVASYGSAGIVFFALPPEGTRWVVSAVSSGAALPGDAPRVAQVKQWLASPDWTALQGLGEDLIERHEKDRAVLDAVAARIGQAQAINNTYMADALAWLCKALVSSGDGRYKKFLAHIATTAATPRLRGHAGPAADRLPDGVEPQFDLDQYTAEQERLKAAPKATSN